VNIVILNQSESPIYEQVYEQIAAQILSGELPPNETLPSIRTVAKELAISIITVKKAWEMLEQSELIYTRPGLGCFVSGDPELKLKDKKYELASNRLQKDILYYKNLGFTVEELIALIKKNF
jgi:GntR family transcriptional regulator